MKDILFRSEVIAITQCKGYKEIMLRYQPIHVLQIILWPAKFYRINLHILV